MTAEAGILFSGRIASGVTVYVPVPIRDGTIGATIGWPDAVSSAAITLELASGPYSATTAGTAAQWHDSALTFTGPAASAAGSIGIDVENCRQRLARIKVVTAAVTTLDIWDGTA